MNSWTDGYVTDIGYTHGFYREMAPNMINFNALINGYKPLTGKLNYCELGCGQGFTTNILAASNPQIEFYATDFNPSQIAWAKSLASDADTKNVHFYDLSFEEFDNEPTLPAKFDMIALHGIYSWISAKNRQNIVQFIKRRLNPGGFVYISYNTLPGWAPAMPLRRLLIEGAAAETRSDVRTKSALDFAEAVRHANANYLIANPSVITRLEKLRDVSPNYLAHEYLNKDWTPFYFSEIAEDLAEAKLKFVGSATPLESVDIINLNEAQRDWLGTHSDPIKRQTLRDFIVNQQFRRDIFVRGGVNLTTSELKTCLLDTKFYSTTDVNSFDYQVNGLLGSANLNKDIYEPILTFFQKTPKTLREYCDTFSGYSGADIGNLNQAIIILVGAGHLHPNNQMDSDSEEFNTSKLNDCIIRCSADGHNLSYLSSRDTGSGIIVDKVSQFLLDAKRKNVKDPISHAWKILQKMGETLIKDGNILTTEAENVEQLTAIYTKFESNYDAFLRRTIE